MTDVARMSEATCGMAVVRKNPDIASLIRATIAVTAY
jgi:hypothetical protein